MVKKRPRVIALSDSEEEVQTKRGREGGMAGDVASDDESDVGEGADKEEDGKATKKLAAIFEKKAPMETSATWKKGEPVPYAALARAFVDIEATTKRLIILEILTNFFVQVIRLSPDDMLPCVYLCINRLCPDYEGLELGIGESLLIKSIAQSTGRDVARLKKDLEQKGDLGLVAIVSREERRIAVHAAHSIFAGITAEAAYNVQVSRTDGPQRVQTAQGDCSHDGK